MRALNRRQLQRHKNPLAQKISYISQDFYITLGAVMIIIYSSLNEYTLNQNHAVVNIGEPVFLVPRE